MSSFTLPSGRTVSIESFFTRFTMQGILEGEPEVIAQVIRRRAKHAAQSFAGRDCGIQWLPTKYAYCPTHAANRAKILGDATLTDKERRRELRLLQAQFTLFERMWVMVAVELRCPRPLDATDPDALWSSLLLCWMDRRPPLNLQEAVAARLHRIRWEKYARDGGV